eukprot:COSAG04_NODE_26752_length_291_cov_0.802083_1_plen_75_part_01
MSLLRPGTGYDWVAGSKAAGACRARFPVLPKHLPPGFQSDPSDGICSNVTGSNNATDGSHCYRKLEEPAFGPCPP